MEVEEESRDKWVALLRGVKFFDVFDDGDLEKLLDAGHVRRFNLHEYIIREGDSDHSFFVILKGKAKIIKMGPLKKKKELWPLAKGDCFGEVGLLLQDQRTASVLASGECFVFRIDAGSIAALSTTTREKLYLRIAVFLAERLKSTTDYAVSPCFI